jgi:hypothetical protein
MQTILLNEKQSSIVNESRAPIPVRDPAGKLLGSIVTGPVEKNQFDRDRWIEYWQEWYIDVRRTADWW